MMRVNTFDTDREEARSSKATHTTMCVWHFARQTGLLPHDGVCICLCVNLGRSCTLQYNMLLLQVLA